MALSLLWLMLPSVGLAAYVQYAYKHYEDKIKECEKNILKEMVDIMIIRNIKIPYIMEVLSLPDHYKNIFVKIMEREGKRVQLGTEQAREKYALLDELARINKNLISFIGIIVLSQYLLIAIDNDTFSMLLSFVLVFLFFFAFFYSLAKISKKRKEWIDINMLLDSHISPFPEKEERIRKVLENIDNKKKSA